MPGVTSAADASCGGHQTTVPFHERQLRVADIDQQRSMPDQHAAIDDDHLAPVIIALPVARLTIVAATSSGEQTLPSKVLAFRALV